jgi:hypothetical protein
MKINNIELPIELAARLTEFRKAMKTARKLATDYSNKYPPLADVLLKTN